MESHVYYCTAQCHISIISYHPMWDRWDCPTCTTAQLNPMCQPMCPSHVDRWDCPMESHVYTAQLNSMCPSYPTFPCGTGGTVPWNPTCTTAQLIPCVRPILLPHGIPCVPLHSLIPCVHPILPSHVGQVGLSHGIPRVPLHSSFPHVRPILLSHVGQVELSHGIPWVPLHSSILRVSPVL